jgi:excisionase family DNA binding protein
MLITIKQAAEATGKSKATILRAIQAHRISATKDDVSGAWMTDPAELHRVFPPVANDAWNAVQDQGEPGSVMRRELAMMQQRLEEFQHERERERTDKDAVIADLREDRDRWRTQAEKLLLTDQRAAAATEALVTPPPPPATAPKAHRWSLFGKRRAV